LAEIEDIILGCAMPEAESGMNVARIARCEPGYPWKFRDYGEPVLSPDCNPLLWRPSGSWRARGRDSGGAHESMSLIPMGGKQNLAESMADGITLRFLPQHGFDRENLARK